MRTKVDRENIVELVRRINDEKGSCVWTELSYTRDSIGLKNGSDEEIIVFADEGADMYEVWIVFHLKAYPRQLWQVTGALTSWDIHTWDYPKYDAVETKIKIVSYYGKIEL